MTTPVPIRLHITPLNQALLPVVLGPVLAKSAENVSYQTIETFPENDYGFVDLPHQDAKKLITKLNGAILKGKKMKVEEARPRKRSRETADDEEEASKPEESRKKSKKEKKAANVLEGHELPTGRKVKRGWTVPKSGKSPSSKKDKDKDKDKSKRSKNQTPSKYSDKEEVLFHTNLPPNKQDLSTAKKDKKGKKKDTAQNVIHEFEKTAPQPSFLRDTTTVDRATEYLEHVGWIDDKGDVLEKEPSNLKRKRPAKAEGLKINVPSPSKAGKASTPSEHEQSRSNIAPSSSSGSEVSTTSDTSGREGVQHDETSSSGITSSSASSTESQSEAESVQEEALQPSQPLTQAATETPPKVHPLEALFKKPNPPTGNDAAKPSLEVETSFSFFGQAAEENDELPPMPNTPFASQDMYSRGVRSAAPTPDTAHPSRFTSFASALAAHTQDLSSDEDLGEADAAHHPDTPVQQPEKRGESDFEKRFWAERGPNNRAWKASKRAALKEQRQQQNRFRRPRNR